MGSPSSALGFAASLPKQQAKDTIFWKDSVYRCNLSDANRGHYRYHSTQSKDGIPSGYVKIAIYWKSPFIVDFPNWKWWFSIVMLVYQRVNVNVDFDTFWLPLTSWKNIYTQWNSTSKDCWNLFINIYPLVSLRVSGTAWCKSMQINYHSHFNSSTFIPESFAQLKVENIIPSKTGKTSPCSWSCYDDDVDVDGDDDDDDGDDDDGDDDGDDDDDHYCYHYHYYDDEICPPPPPHPHHHHQQQQHHHHHHKYCRMDKKLHTYYYPCCHSLGGVGVPHFVVNQPLSLQNGSGTQSPSYKMVHLLLSKYRSPGHQHPMFTEIWALHLWSQLSSSP